MSFVSPHVELALLELARIEDPAALAQRYLTTAEWEAYSRLGHPERRRQWLGARVCVKTLLVRRGAIAEPQDCEIHKDRRGRPRLTLAPWAEPGGPYDCSLAHTGRFACACLVDVPGARVGVDVEPVTPRLQKLAHLFVSPQDALLPSRPRQIELTVLWCLKEAGSKVIGRGLGAGLNRLVCVETEDGRHVVRIAKRRPLHAWDFFYDGYVVALCLKLPAGLRNGELGQPIPVSGESLICPLEC